jgi:RNA polymerase sigma-70 factor (ECF subfamily)
MDMRRDNETLRTDGTIVGESDEALYARFAAARDDDIFALLVRRHQQFVYRTSLSICGRESLAEDATQETFIQLARSDCGFFDKGAGSFRAWLYRVTGHVAKNMLRTERRAMKRARRRTEGGGEAERAPAAAVVDETTDNPENCVALRRALLDLREELRVPIMLHFLEGVPQTEVGRMMGVSQSLVARRIEKGLRLLRHRLSDGGVSLSVAALTTALLEPTLFAPPATLFNTLASVKATMAVAGQTAGAGASVKSVGGAAVFSWPLVAVIAVVVTTVGVVGWYIEESKIGSRGTEQFVFEPEKYELEKPDKTQTAKRLNLKWTFEKGPPDDFRVLAGGWRWGTDANGRKCMIVDENFVAVLPVALRKVPYCVTIRSRVAGKNQLWNVAANWRLEKEGQSFQMWSKKFIIEKPGLVSKNYFFDEWLTRAIDGEIHSVGKHASAYPSERILFQSLHPASIYEICLEELRYEDLPEQVRDPGQIIERLNVAPQTFTQPQFSENR